MYFSRLSFLQKSVGNNETTNNMEEQPNESQERQSEVNNETSQVNSNAMEVTEVHPPKRKKRNMPEERISDLIENSIESRQSLQNDLQDDVFPNKTTMNFFVCRFTKNSKKYQKIGV